MIHAREITNRLHGHWYGHYGVAACPVCQTEDRRDQSALTIADGDDRLLMHCKRSQCAFRDILAALGLLGEDWAPPSPHAGSNRRLETPKLAALKVRQAETYWQETHSIRGTLAETYLRKRGIACELPKSLRYHSDCWHSPSAQLCPAMIAAVENLQGATAPAIHRTFLESDGSGKTKRQPSKMMLGSTAGGCVRLSGGPGALVVCEGIETGLSLLSGLISERHPTVVAALSASGMKGLALPEPPGRMIICPDGDVAGMDAAQDLGFRASSMGWQVETLQMPSGMDANDLLQMQKQQGAA